MNTGIIASARRRTQAWLGTSYGVLMGTANDNSTTTAEPSAVAALSIYSYTAYDPLSWKQDNATIEVPSNSNVQLGRIITATYVDQAGISHQQRKWDGSAYNTFVGYGFARPNKGASQSNNEGAVSAILALSAGDLFQHWKGVTNTSNCTNGGTRNYIGVEVIPPGTRYTFATRGATAQTIGTTRASILWNGSDVVDTLNSHDPTTNSQNFVVPSDTTGRIRVSAQVISSAANVGTLSVWITQNGSDVTRKSVNMGTGTPANNISSRILIVSPGDIIAIDAQLGVAGAGIGATNDGMWACVEELPAGHRFCTAAKATNQSIGSPTDITWDGTDIYDPEALHDPVTNNKLITFPGDAQEYRVTYGLTATAVGLSYTNASPAYRPGYAGHANGQLWHNDMGPWNQISGGLADMYLQGFGLSSITAGATDFFQVEFR